MPQPELNTVFFYRLCTCVGILAFLSAPAAAQTVPGELFPGRQSPPPREIPKSVPTAATTGVGQATAPEGAEKISIVFGGITLERSTVFKQQDVQDIWQADIGKKIAIARVYEFVNQITQRYADKGYALSFAFLPEQQIENNGKITVRVVEGFVDEIKFDDRRATPDTSSIEHMREMTRGILNSRPLKTADLERYLLLINDTPGMHAETTFSASPSTPGASNLIVSVTGQKINASLSANNHLSSTLDFWNFTAQGQINNLLSSQDQLTLTQGCGLRCDTFSQTDVQWATYIGTEGLKISLTYDQSRLIPLSGLLSQVDFTGRTTSGKIDVNYPYIRSRQKNFNVGASFEIGRNSTKTSFGILSQDDTRVLKPYMTYDFSDDTGAINFIKAEINQGLPVFNATEEDDPHKSKSLGSGTYTAFEITASRNQPLYVLSPKLQQYSLYLSAQTQLASRPLLGSAQCYYGSDDFGRGYTSGSIGGDNCMMGSLELRRDQIIYNLPVQFYGFMDAGFVWKEGNLPPGEDSQIGAQSAGGGMRITMGSKTSGGVELAWPLRQSVTSDGKSSPKLLFTFRVQY